MPHFLSMSPSHFQPHSEQSFKTARHHAWLMLILYLCGSEYFRAAYRSSALPLRYEIRIAKYIKPASSWGRIESPLRAFSALLCFDSRAISFSDDWLMIEKYSLFQPPLTHTASTMELLIKSDATTSWWYMDDAGQNDFILWFRFCSGKHRPKYWLTQNTRLAHFWCYLYYIIIKNAVSYKQNRNKQEAGRYFTRCL